MVPEQSSPFQGNRLSVAISSLVNLCLIAKACNGVFSMVFWEYLQGFWVAFPLVLLPEESPPELLSVLLPRVFERPRHVTSATFPGFWDLLLGFCFIKGSVLQCQGKLSY